MSIVEIFRSYQTQEQAIEHLEKVRWRGQPRCPYCASLAVGRHASGDRNATRWQCRNCSRAFSATVGTPFHGTHVPLRNWFLVLALTLDTKKPASAYQIARDLDMRRATVWSMMQRIRTAIAGDAEQHRLLHGIVGADLSEFDSISDDSDKRDNGEQSMPNAMKKEPPVKRDKRLKGRAIVKLTRCHALLSRAFGALINYPWLSRRPFAELAG